MFLIGALVLGVYLSPRVFRLASRLGGHGVLLTTALAFCFGLAYLASVIGLAPIVGAYAAGLILEDVHFEDFQNRGEQHLESLVQPISTFLVPIFFVVMGMRVDLTVFGQLEVLGLAGLLTVAAILGKQVCSLGAGRNVDRLSVGIGMVPRGEVGSDLCEYRFGPDAEWVSGRRWRGVFGHRHDGHRDHNGDATGPEVEP